MDDRQRTIKRRQVLAGAATTGALAVAATLLPGGRQAAPGHAEQDAAARPESGGYRLTEHVKRYYETTRI